MKKKGLGEERRGEERRGAEKLQRKQETMRER